MLEILYQDQALVVCVKPFRVLSTCLLYTSRCV